MKRPNILIFMTDHQRGDTIFANSKVFTPNIDKIRTDCIEFTNAHCPSPHCCPARATFFTGLYPAEHGVWNNVNVSNTLSRGLYDGVKCFSEDLKENGYKLFFSGKWHVSQEESPEARGFELIYHQAAPYKKFAHVPEYSEWNVYEDKENMDRGTLSRLEGQIVREGYPRYIQYGIDENPFGDEFVVEHAVKKIRELRNTKSPFLLYTGVLGPHDPYYVPQRFLDLYQDMEIDLPVSFYDNMQDKPALYRRTKSHYAQLSEEEHKESMRRFFAFCSYEDYLFGKLIDALKKNDLYDDTVVMYVSDHGDYIGAHGLWAKGLPCFREAYHVCSLIGGGYFKRAGFIQGRTCDEMVSLADYAPTILELCGVKVDRKFTGSSLIPFFRGRRPDDWRMDFYTQSNGNEVYGIQRCVYNGKWKYVFNSFDFDELYHLENDPHEMHNLIYCERPQDTEYAAIVREMCEKMWNFAYQTHDNCVNPYIMTAMAPYGPGIIRR